MYIHELAKWPDFGWDDSRLIPLLAKIHQQQGRLLGQMESLGFALREQASLQSLTAEVIKSSEIEGEHLDQGQVRSSLARRLGIDIGGLTQSDRHVDGIVEMMLDATQKHEQPLTADRLFGWHSALFPAGRSGMSKITVGKWRDDHAGPMQVISGPVGRPKVHFEAPEASRLKSEMREFLRWFNAKKPVDPLLKAALAHLWFVTVHPFEDGNGRMARAITDLALARSENSPHRFYSMSAQICVERKAYYDILEQTQKGSLDITDWLEWFLSCLGRAFLGSEKILASVLQKDRFWKTHSADDFSDRQKKILLRLLDGFGPISSSKWAKLGKCSQDTAARDIEGLLKRGILTKSEAGGRSTSYRLLE